VAGSSNSGESAKAANSVTNKTTEICTPVGKEYFPNVYFAICLFHWSLYPNTAQQITLQLPHYTHYKPVILIYHKQKLGQLIWHSDKAI
jgi:hypothetical protein